MRPLPALAAALAAAWLLSNDARATCWGSCTLALDRGPDEQTAFWPSDRPLAVTGACMRSCSAPGGPGSTVVFGAKDVLVTEPGTTAAPIGGFVETTKGHYRLATKLASGKVWSVGWSGGADVSVPVADAAVIAASGPPAVFPGGASREYLANGAKVSVPKGAMLLLQLVGGRVSVLGPAELAIEEQTVRLTAGTARAVSGTVRVRTTAGAAKIVGTGFVGVAADATRFGAWSGTLEVAGQKLAEHHGVVVRKGKFGKPVSLAPSPALPKDEIAFARPKLPTLAAVAPPPTGASRLWVVSVPPVATDPVLHRVYELPGDAAAFATDTLALGTHHLRWSAIDADGLESEAGPARELRVAHTEILHRPTKRASIFFPGAGFCGLDGGPLVDLPSAELPLVPARAHVLRCARTPTGVVSEHVISAADAGKVTLDVQASKLLSPGTRELLVRVIDAGGNEVPGVALTVTLTNGSVDPVEEVPSPYGGRRYRTRLRWSPGAQGLIVTVTAPGGFTLARTVPSHD